MTEYPHNDLPRVGQRESRRSTAPRRFWSNPPLVTMVVLLALAIIGGISYLVDMSMITSEGTQRETQLRAEYDFCQGRLSQYYVNGENSLKIADANAQQIKEIITATADGKYGTSADLKNPRNPVYLAIYQAYPNTGSISDAYKAAQSVLVGSFDNYTAENQKLWTMLSEYDNWRTGSFLQSPLIARAGFPSNRLVATVGTRTLYRDQAEAQMWKVVADPRVAQSYDSGTLQPIPFPTSGK